MSEAIKEFRLSTQAIGSVMMALQKSLMDQTDIVPIFQEWTMLVNEEDNLIYVKNPPLVKVSEEGEEK